MHYPSPKGPSQFWSQHMSRYRQWYKKISMGESRCAIIVYFVIHWKVTIEPA